MAIMLSSVMLNDHMVWEDEIGSDNSVAQTTKRTLGGNLVVVSQQLSKGVPITLLATEKQGWLTKAQVLAVEALAVEAGAVLPLVIGPNNFTVMFRHEESPAFIAEPLDQVGAQAPDGYYTAIIKLMTV